VCRFVEAPPGERSVVIASERLTEERGDWIRVAPNHVLIVTADLEVSVELMEEVRRPGPRASATEEAGAIGVNGFAR
jgi:hypothetical protein